MFLMLIQMFVHFRACNSLRKERRAQDALFFFGGEGVEAFFLELLIFQTCFLK